MERAREKFGSSARSRRSSEAVCGSGDANDGDDRAVVLNLSRKSKPYILFAYTILVVGCGWGDGWARVGVGGRGGGWR